MLADVMTRTLLPLQSATRRLVQPGGRGRGWGVGILSLFHHQDRMRVHTALALNDSRKLQFSTDLLPPLPLPKILIVSKLWRYLVLTSTRKAC